MSVKIKINWDNENAVSDSVRIYRADSTFTSTNLPPLLTEIFGNVYEYEDFDVVEGQTYYYMLSAKLREQEAFTECFEVVTNIEQPLPNEMYFTTTEGSVNYIGTQGDQILLSNGTILDVTVTDDTFTFSVPAGKHKVKFVESVDRSNFVSVGGEALIELHNFPTLSTVTRFNLYPDTYSPNLVKVPTVLPSNLTSIAVLFYGATNFNQDISMWNTSNVTDMGYMFDGATTFNQPLNNWNVSNVTTMQGMFYNAVAFNQDIGSWDVSNVIDMGSMFNNASAFNQDISSWNVSNVTNMAYMFFGAASFNQPLNNWDVSNVNSMYHMFMNAITFDQPLNNWDVSNVNGMNSMFYNAISFNQDLSQWCVSNITSSPEGFDDGATNWTLPRPVWGTCPSGENAPDGDWIINQGYEIVGNDIKYTAYKTNGLDYYDSFALADLVQALVKSFNDEDMQEWQGLLDALSVHKQALATKGYEFTWLNTGCHLEHGDTCAVLSQIVGETLTPSIYGGNPSCKASPDDYILTYCDVYPDYVYTFNHAENNVRYVADGLDYTVSYSTIIQTLLSNLNSSNSAILLHAENYIQQVINSIFNTESSKQFVKLEDLIPQLETNKVLRS